MCAGRDAASFVCCLPISKHAMMYLQDFSFAFLNFVPFIHKCRVMIKNLKETIRHPKWSDEQTNFALSTSSFTALSFLNICIHICSMEVE